MQRVWLRFSARLFQINHAFAQLPLKCLEQNMWKYTLHSQQEAPPDLNNLYEVLTKPYRGITVVEPPDGKTSTPTYDKLG